MTDGSGPRDELRAAIESLSEERARTLLGWLRMDRRQRETVVEADGVAALAGEQTVGPLGDVLGIVGELREPGFSRMRLSVDPAFFNPNGVLHGGVIYTMIDYSMGGAVQVGLPEGEHCATIEVKVSYLSPVREGELVVETKVVKQGRNIAFTESKVWDSERKLIATGSGSLFILRGEKRQ
jgi:acyl-CoA thioesterase